MKGKEQTLLPLIEKLIVITFFGYIIYQIITAISSILFPFVFSGIIAYLLHPAVDRLQKYTKSRGMASFLMIFGFMALCIGGIILLSPLLYDQFVNLSIKLNAYFKGAYSYLFPMISKKLHGSLPNLQAHLPQLEQILGKSKNILGNLWLSSKSMIHTASLLFITPVVTFYMLRDWQIMVSNINEALPARYAANIRLLAREMDLSLSGFIRGQTYVCLILGAIYSIGLIMVGLDFALLIGLATGIFSFIPYVGMLAGFTAGMIIAYLQFGIGTKLLMVAIVFLIGQILEAHVISPTLIGDKVGLHPVWIIFSLLAGGAVAGFVGILVAIPMAAIIGVAVRFILHKKYIEA